MERKIHADARCPGQGEAASEFHDDELIIRPIEEVQRIATYYLI
jgi:hypothetical protein